VPQQDRGTSPAATAADWTTPLLEQDFVSDQMFDGRRFRALTLVDNYSRECLEIEVGQNRKGFDVVAVMERIKALRGVVPQRIQCDNGSEFISKALDKWAYDNQVTLDFSRPGKPTDNPFIESFNGSFRDECLNVNWFLSLEDAKEKIGLFKEEYNGFRPHSSLSGLTPNEVVQQHSHGPIFPFEAGSEIGRRSTLNFPYLRLVANLGRAQGNGE
jgi:putative transposase